MARAATAFVILAQLLPVVVGKRDVGKTNEREMLSASDGAPFEEDFVVFKAWTSEQWRNDIKTCQGDPSVAPFDRRGELIQQHFLSTFLEDTVEDPLRPNEGDVSALFGDFNMFLDKEINNGNQPFPEPFVPVTLKDYNHVLLGAKLRDDPGGTPDYLAKELFEAGAGLSLKTVSRTSSNDVFKLAPLSRAQNSAAAKRYSHIQCDFSSAKEGSVQRDCVGNLLNGHQDEKTIVWFTFGHHDDFDLNVGVAKNAKLAIADKSSWKVVFTATDAILPFNSPTCYKYSWKKLGYSIAKLTQLEILLAPKSNDLTTVLDGITRQAKALMLSQNTEKEEDFDSKAYDGHYHEVMKSLQDTPNVVQVEHLSAMATEMQFEGALGENAGADKLHLTGHKFPPSQRPVAWILKRLKNLISIKQAVHLHLQAAQECVVHRNYCGAIRGVCGGVLFAMMISCARW